MVAHYEIYGLRMASEIELPEMWSADGAVPLSPDVEIKLGEAPHEINGVGDGAGEYVVGAAGILFDMPDIGRFWAVGGHTLVVDPAPGANINLVRLFILGSGLAAVLHQRGAFPLHASAIAHAGKCFAFLGASGAGKSTLASMLSQRGFPIVSDDVLIVSVPTSGTGEAVTAPGIPVLKLWPESAAISGFEDFGAPYEAPGVGKHRISVADVFSRQTLPIVRLYGLEWHDGADRTPEIVALGGFDAIKLMRANVYRNNLIQAMNREAAFVGFASALLRSAQPFAFRREQDFANAESQLDTIERHIRSA
jgi:hypothetical protein